MKTLLLIGHGSRKPSANEDVKIVAQALYQRLSLDNSLVFDRVDVAFLEMASPSIEQALDRLIDAGANKIFVLPYFLTRGRHVEEDIPRILESYRSALASKSDASNPITFTLLPHLGAQEAVLDALVNCLS